MGEQQQGPGTPPNSARMRGQNGQSGPAGAPHPGDATHFVSGRAPADALTGDAAHAASMPAADVWQHDADDLAEDEHLGARAGATLSHEMRMRLRARQTSREFLRSVPRSEPEATLVITRIDGSARMLTRGQLTAAIDRMRPRMRQVIRLAVEERWSRSRVCAYLQNISLKTLERDYVEGMDYLAQEL